MPINGNIPKDVNSGDAIKSQDMNDILRQLRLLSSTAGGQNAIVNGAGAFSTPPPTDDLRNTAFVWVRNDTGADIDAAYPILELSTIVNAPDDDDQQNLVPYALPAFSGTTPDTDTTKFAILQGKVKNGEWRYGIVAGTSWVKIVVDSDSDEMADISNGHNTYLTSSSSGPCKILWKETSGSTRWANVLFSTNSSGSEFAIVQPTGLCYGIGLACDCVTAYVWFASCGSSIKQGDIINVWDPQRCWFNVPPEILFNMLVYVSKYNNREDSPIHDESPEEEYNPPRCVWFATGLCCVEGASPA